MSEVTHTWADSCSLSLLCSLPSQPRNTIRSLIMNSKGVVKKTWLVGCTFIHSERADCTAIIISCGWDSLFVNKENSKYKILEIYDILCLQKTISSTADDDCWTIEMFWMNKYAPYKRFFFFNARLTIHN